MKNLFKEIGKILFYIAIAAVFVWGFSSVIGQQVIVSGSSMEPTFQDGDNVFINKFTYLFSDPERFDVIVFPLKNEKNTYYIKRIIGLPGETVQIGEDGTIYINGEVLNEDYGAEIINADMIGLAENPVMLGKEEYFVLGDNRNYSNDSRMDKIGNIKKSDIIGKVSCKLIF